MSKPLKRRWIEVVVMDSVGNVPLHKRTQEAHQIYNSPERDPAKRVVPVKAKEIRDMREGSTLDGATFVMFSLRGHENASRDGGSPTMKEFFLPVSVKTLIDHLEFEPDIPAGLHRAEDGKMVYAKDPSP